MSVSFFNGDESSDEEEHYDTSCKIYKTPE